jgi:hypothetical protein
MKVGDTFTEKELEDFHSKCTIVNDRLGEVERFFGYQSVYYRCQDKILLRFEDEYINSQYHKDDKLYRWYTYEQFVALGKNPNLRLLL